MNVLVVGGGHLGRKVAEELDRTGHEVAIIEEDEEKLSMLNTSFGGVTFLCFPMDINNLRNAGIESCDAVAVTTSDDNLNITVGQIAKNIFGVKTVVSRITDPFREYIFESFGLQTVCPTNMACDSIVAALTADYSRKRLSFGTNTVSFSVRPVGVKDVAKLLSDIRPESGETVFGLLNKAGSFIMNFPYDSPSLEIGDSIVYAKKID